MPARKVTPVVPEPAHVRRIQGSFAWLDHRLLRGEHLDGMTLAEIGVYVFLVLAADRSGVSFYRKDVIARRLGIDWGEFEQAKGRLLGKGLVAFRPYAPGGVDGFYQVLSIPPGGPA